MKRRDFNKIMGAAASLSVTGVPLRAQELKEVNFSEAVHNLGTMAILADYA